MKPGENIHIISNVRQEKKSKDEQSKDKPRQSSLFRTFLFNYFFFREVGVFLIKHLNFDGRLLLEDKRQISTRLILDNSIRQIGDPIELKNATSQDVYVKISQTIYDEDVNSVNCKIFPNHEFDSYQSCDINFMR